MFLLSGLPSPRTYKRIMIAKSEFRVFVLYRDRGTEYFPFVFNDKDINMWEIISENEQAWQIPINVFLLYLKRSITVLKNIEPEVIHCSNLDMLVVASIYNAFSPFKARIVYEIADLHRYTFAKRINDPSGFVARILQWVERRLTRNIANLILTSPYFWEVYYSDFVDESKYLFLPNAPSKKLFASYEKQKNEIFTIGFIGSVRYVKQLKMLIDAVGEMDKNIKVFIAGSGPGYQVIAEYIKDKPWVEMHGPYNYEQEIVSLYEKVDCVYSVYDTELENVKVALPNRLYEAIVCELPIIAAKGTALGKFIEEKEIGATVGANDKEGLKSILTKWVSDENLIQQYSFNCKLIKEDYYYENNSDKLLELYRNLA